MNNINEIGHAIANSSGVVIDKTKEIITWVASLGTSGTVILLYAFKKISKKLLTILLIAILGIAFYNIVKIYF